jgi:hypothetical protein
MLLFSFQNFFCTPVVYLSLIDWPEHFVNFSRCKHANGDTTRHILRLPVLFSQYSFMNFNIAPFKN